MKHRKIHKLLIANRGEIARRIIRTARTMGIQTVAIHAPADAQSAFVAEADESYPLMGNSLDDSYLSIGQIMEIARLAQVDAVHPGYGFLAENPDLVEACENDGLVFVGPSAAAIRQMGNKIEAREQARKAGVPLVEGATGSPDELMARAKGLKYPVLVKAAAGGGGKGMRIVGKADELKAALTATAREAKAYFGSDTVYLEHYLEQPRHIEIQVLADEHGHAVHLNERECSLQRRFQKIVEEAPSLSLTPEIRQQMGKAALRLVQQIGYTNAGTIEFLMDETGGFYFLEMNTRIQVEHAITEMITGVDLVEEQLRIAAGEPLRIQQQAVTIQGHAIECRIYAEDPDNNFQPSPGPVLLYHPPEGPGIRVDSITDQPTQIHSYYDPMVAKLVVHGPNRESARLRLIEALKQFGLQGVKSNIPFLIGLLSQPDYCENRISTTYVDKRLLDLNRWVAAQKMKMHWEVPVLALLMYGLAAPLVPQNTWEAIGYWRQHALLPVCFEGDRFVVELRQREANRFVFYRNHQAYHCEIKNKAHGRLLITINQNYHTVFLSGQHGRFHLNYQGLHFDLGRPDYLAEEDLYSAYQPDLGPGGTRVVAPMPGKIIRVLAVPGQSVSKGQVLLIVESMKMENEIVAPHDGVVETVNVAKDDLVETHVQLIDLK